VRVSSLRESYGFMLVQDIAGNGYIVGGRDGERRSVIYSSLSLSGAGKSGNVAVYIEHGAIAGDRIGGGILHCWNAAYGERVGSAGNYSSAGARGGPGCNRNRRGHGTAAAALRDCVSLAVGPARCEAYLGISFHIDTAASEGRVLAIGVNRIWQKNAGARPGIRIFRSSDAADAIVQILFGDG